MTTQNEFKQGEFCWIELSTKDVSQAKKFYGELFGWSFDDMPAGPGMTYSMAKLDGKHVGGLFEMGAEMAKMMPTAWASYISVGDVDAITAKAEASGGKVMKPAFDVMDVGRMSVVADPTGAVFCLWQEKKGNRTMVKGEPGSLCWNEVFTTNVDRAGAFYRDVLGYGLEPHDMGPMGVYTLLKAPGVKDSVGGMMPMPKEMQGVPSHWLAYIAVTDVDASTKKATDLGAEVMAPPMDIPNIGRFSIVADPGGAAIALYKNAH